MKQIEEFYPADGYPDLSIGRMMFGGAVVFAVMMIFIPTGDIAPRIILFGVGVLIVLFNLAFVRYPVYISIARADNIVTCQSLDVLGIKHTARVTLENAKISYRYSYVSRSIQGWKLRLYNNLLTSNITLTERRMFYPGFSKDQLDEIVEVIKSTIP